MWSNIQQTAESLLLGKRPEPEVKFETVIDELESKLLDIGMEGGRYQREETLYRDKIIAHLKNNNHHKATEYAHKFLRSHHMAEIFRKRAKDVQRRMDEVDQIRASQQFRSDTREITTILQNLLNQHSVTGVEEEMKRYDVTNQNVRDFVKVLGNHMSSNNEGYQENIDEVIFQALQVANIEVDASMRGMFLTQEEKQIEQELRKLQQEVKL